MRYPAIVLVTTMICCLARPALTQGGSGSVLQAAQIVSPTSLDVTVPPAAVTLSVKVAPPGLYSLAAIRFALRSPSGHQVVTGERAFAFDQVYAFDGLVQTVFGGGGLHRHGLNLYSQPGTWHLDSITLCFWMGGQCSKTSGTALAALVAQRSVSVTNNGDPWVGLPVVTSAAIATPTLREQLVGAFTYGVAPFQISLVAQAQAPGIVAAQARFVAPSGQRPPCIGSFLNPVFYAKTPDLGPPLTALSTTLATPVLTCPQGVSPVGVYTLDLFKIADEAGNLLEVSDPAKLKALFPGGTTVTVTP